MADFFNEKRILVTGGSGFVGSRLVTALHNRGAHLKMLVRTINHDLCFDQVQCDLSQCDIPIDCLTGVSIIFHLAGFTHDFRDPKKVEKEYRRVNVDASIQLAKLAARGGVKRFVFVSSVKAGGTDLSEVYESDNVPCVPEGVYGQTKREAELAILKIGSETGMHVSIIRPSLVYGLGVKGNLRLMISGIEKGWFPPLPDVSNRRSMIHVDDLVYALFLVAENNKANGEVFIATDGQVYSARELYETICIVMGKPIPQWSIPKCIFDFISLINPGIRYKIDKLLGDEWYSSGKLESLGFTPQRIFKDFKRSSF